MGFLKLKSNFWVALYNVFVELVIMLLLFILTVLFRLFVLSLNYLTDSAFIKYWCCQVMVEHLGGDPHHHCLGCNRSCQSQGSMNVGP